MKGRLYLAVGLGSGLGGSCRWWLGLAADHYIAGSFPWGTLLANISGCLLIGLYAAMTVASGRLLASPVQRQFVMGGFCGGYTSFSVFSLENLQLAQSGQGEMAALYTAVSIASWLLAVWLGFGAGSAWRRRHPPAPEQA